MTGGFGQEPPTPTPQMPGRSEASPGRGEVGGGSRRMRWHPFFMKSRLSYLVRLKQEVEVMVVVVGGGESAHTHTHAHTGPSSVCLASTLTCLWLR